METKEKQLPAREIKISISGNTYNVKFPNNGQLIDIESRKVQLSGGTQKDLMLSQSPSAAQAFILIETIATFSILIPELKDNLNVSILDLDPFRSKELVKQYTKVFYPWFKQWMDIINSDDEITEA
jgi:hypothetical protein